MDERSEINFIVTRLKDVIENAVSLCREKANAKKIKIEQEYNEEISARIDAYLLEQAFIDRNFAMAQMNIHMDFDPLRSYDRFQKIIDKMNFP